MSPRRTPAPDIAACVLLLFAAALFFAVLRAVYSTSTVGGALFAAAAYLGLLSACAVTARAIFLRRPAGLPAGVALMLFTLGAALSNFHVPETAELPAGVLGLLGATLLVASRREFSTRAR